ncbi:MAG: transposase [Magnetococcales bacterium]|nr:transposase [Magnetococcales bacterium]MBF0584449.1 transposase [Magnetococcales bacterium]
MDTTSPKHRYRIRNWQQYNAALVNRGRLTLWFDDDAISQWFMQEKTGKRGASQTCTDVAIQRALTLQEVYRLPLRGIEGVLSSLIRHGEPVSPFRPEKTPPLGRTNPGSLLTHATRSLKGSISWAARIGRKCRIIIVVALLRQPFFDTRQFLETG